jgi:hypothetical protein
MECKTGVYSLVTIWIPLLVTCCFKRPKREADHLPSSTDEAKNEGKYTSTPPQEGTSKSFRTGRLERELQMVQLSATSCSCIAILWISLVSFAATTLYVASQRVFIIVVVVYFVIDSVRKLLDTSPYVFTEWCLIKHRTRLHGMVPT